MDNLLKDYTTLSIGGPAKIIKEIKTPEELIECIKNEPSKYLIIGSGSNLLVSDQGFDGAVFKNTIRDIDKKGNILTVKSGTVLQELVDFANENGLAGLETLAGIPGTVGGAVYGNAGAYGQTISDHLVLVTTLDPDNLTIRQFNNSECNFSYRDSIFKLNKFIILEAVFSLTSEDSRKLNEISSDTIKKRSIKYPPGIKCPGSFFKNIPAGTLPSEILAKIPNEFILFNKVSAGALLESVGAKGAKRGQIKIADYHANLFINEGGGTAKDFYELAKDYGQKVFESFGIRLEPEVQLINLPPFS